MEYLEELGKNTLRRDQADSLKIPKGLSWRRGNRFIQTMTEGWKFPEGVFWFNVRTGI